MEDLVACIGKPHLEFHFWRLSVTNNANEFYMTRLVVFQDLVEGEERGFNTCASSDTQVQRYKPIGM